MGGWRFVRERFLDGDVSAGGRTLRYVGRKESASPAAGSQKVHLQEQQAILEAALAADVPAAAAAPVAAAGTPTA